MDTRCVWSIFLCCSIFACCLSRNEYNIDSSPLPHVFETDRLPLDEDREINMRYMPGLGNGHFATNVYSDTLYMNGVYNGHTDKSYRARIPAYHAVNISVRGAPETNRTYTLNVKTGIFQERIQTSDVTVTYTTFAHKYYNRLLVTHVNVQRQPGSQADITVGEGLPVSNLAGAIDVPETDTSGRTPVHVYYNPMPDNIQLGAGESAGAVWYLMTVDTSDEGARLTLDRALSLNYSVLREEHEAAWRRTWAQGRIEVEGELQLQKVIWGSQFYLYSYLPSDSWPAVPNNPFWSLSPGGLPNGKNGSDYYGHVFWDTETWMYPPVLMFRPDLGKDIINYRLQSMDPAFDRARENGLEGTRYPWESAYTGVETTPRHICIPCGENQQHITGDIGFAVRQYISATRDRDWLRDRQGPWRRYSGWNMTQEIARFWASRPEYNTTTQRYDINNVMPPDEHRQSINNSIYTNLVASLSIHFSRYAACLAGQDPQTEVPDSWIRVAERLTFPFERQMRYHEEYDGFEQERREGRLDPRGVKQADVILMGFPFLWNMPDDVRRRDLAYYETITNPNGPAMTWGMYSIGWLEQGNLTKAGELFTRSYTPYYREPYKIWTESQSGIGAINFITGMGGFLQAVLFGYGGLRLRLEQLTAHAPVLPPGTSRVTFHDLDYMGSRLDVTFNSTTVTVHTRSADFTNRPLQLTAGPTRRWLTAGSTHSFPVQPYVIETTTPSYCAPQRDHIDVDYSPATCSGPSCAPAATLHDHQTAREL